MENKILVNKNIKPTDSILKEVLGETFSFFTDLRDKTKNTFSHEWYFPSLKSGWTFKIFSNGKIFVWIFPYKNKFKASFALREQEKERAIDIISCKEIKDALIKAKKYNEGYALRLDIVDKKTYDDLMELIYILLPMRE